MDIYTVKVTRRLSEIYNYLINSNALYPALISLLYLFLVAGLLSFDHSATAETIKKQHVLLQFKETGTAQSILTTLITGIISLIALSFSMVMVVLSQASSTTSPKVVQGLVTQKSHQFVLGNQVGTILYFLMLLLFLRDKELVSIPIFSILISVILGIWSIGLFVFFIHSISNAIQVPNIVKNIHTATHKSISKLAKQPEVNEKLILEKLSQLEHEYITDKPGFLQEIKINRIVKIAARYKMVIRLHGYLTDYIVSGRTLFHANVASSELPQPIQKAIYDCIVFYPFENIRRNYEYGFTQLSEVAVKALSPGVNDPGIACLCLHYLTDLFIVIYDVQEKRVYTDSHGEVRLIVNKITFKDLFNLCITPIRQYGVKDISVARGLLSLIAVLGNRDAAERRYQQVFNDQAASVLSGIKEKLGGETDQDAINSMVEKMHRIDNGYFYIPKV